MQPIIVRPPDAMRADGMSSMDGQDGMGPMDSGRSDQTAGMGGRSMES